MKGQNGAPDATTKMFFTPVFRNGKWHLILTDSRHGETTVTQDGQTESKELYERRDSLKGVYREKRCSEGSQEITSGYRL